MWRVTEPSAPGTADLLRTAVHAGAAGGLVGALPSTCIALATGGDVFAATRAAGAMLLPTETRLARLLPAAAVVHSGVAIGWALVLSAMLPHRHPALTGAAAGFAIAALDLEVAARWFPRVAALPRGAQLLDHAAYGATVGAVVGQRRISRRGTPEPATPRTSRR